MALGGLDAILLGAAVGAGTSAITGSDPLKGALLGGLGGGLTGGLGGGAGGGGGGGAASGAGAGTTSAGIAGLQNASSALSTSLPASSVAAPSLTSAVPETFNLANAALSPQAAALAPTTGSALSGSGMSLAPSAVSGSAMTAPGAFNMPTGALSSAASAFTPEAAASLPQPSMFQQAKDWWGTLSPTQKLLYGAGGSMALQSLMQPRPQMPGEENVDSGFSYDPRRYTPSLPYAEGGIAGLGGANIAVGNDPRRNAPPISEDNLNQYGWQSRSFPSSSMASGGITSLGSYSDGGRLLKGPGDGMSDHIPAMIGRRQPARLADGEFVVPADVVSHLGNGSTDAGAKQLYAMMDKVRRARTGNVKQGREINARKYMPA